MTDDVKDSIESNAQAPRRIVADGVEVEEHSLKDQIAADKYVRSVDAMSQEHRGLRFNRIKPPGSA